LEKTHFVSVIRISEFEFVLDFDIRISGFETLLPEQVCPAAAAIH
jgi:hypothetical protein